MGRLCNELGMGRANWVLEPFWTDMVQMGHSLEWDYDLGNGIMGTLKEGF